MFKGYFACGRIFFFSSRRRHTRCSRDWSSDVCSSDLLLCPEIVLLCTFCGPAMLGGHGLKRPFLRCRITFIAVAPLQFVNPRCKAISMVEIGRASCRERVETGAVGLRLKEKQWIMWRR